MEGEITANGSAATGDAASVEASVSATAEQSDASMSEAAYADEVQAPQEFTEEDKYWKNVHENSTDFSSWTYLIQLIERQADIEKIRKVYDGFLVYFPLCYVYWKKYADHEANRGNIDKALEVYERGVHGILHSVDLWTHYCTFVSEKSEDVEHTRNLWERAAATIGTDFAAHTFWDKYIEFETSQSAFQRVNALYLRILQTPLEQLTQYHEKFKVFVNARPLSELLLPNEVTELEENKKKQEQKYNELAAKKEEGEAIDAAEMTEAGIKTGDEVEIEFRAHVMANREEMYKKTLEDVTKRRTYEHAVLKRPYFHIKALDDTMLSSWRKYLDLEERESTTINPARVVKLYERCLIAACYYSEFWLRYIKWLETHRGVEDARAVFVRATTIFLLRRADIHLEYALFEEAHGNLTKAREVYEHLAITLPGHVESTIQLASFLRRQGKHEEACYTFDTALTISSLDTKSGPYLSIQYGLFLERVLQAPTRVRDVYDKTLQKFPEHKGLWMAYIQFESTQNDPDKVLALYARAVAEHSKLTAEEKYDLWQSYLEYADYWANNPATVRKLHDTFRTLYPAYAYKAESVKKRPLFDQQGNPADTPSAKVQRTNGTAASPAAAAAAAAAASAAYAQPATAAQYPYPYAAQYAGYTGYPATGYAYPYAGTPATATAGATQYNAAAAGYAYAYPYGYAQPT